MESQLIEGSNYIASITVSSDRVITERVERANGTLIHAHVAAHSEVLTSVPILLLFILPRAMVHRLLRGIAHPTNILSERNATPSSTGRSRCVANPPRATSPIPIP